MPTVDLYNLEHVLVGKAELDDRVFHAKVNPLLYAEVVKWQLAKKRAGSACTKDRSIVSGSTRKLYRQKGTGNARRGSIKSPVLRGGGTIFGPKPRDYSFQLPKKIRKAAMRSILTSRLMENNLFVIDSMKIDFISTKKIYEKIVKFGAGKLLIVDSSNEKLFKSVRNIPGIKFLPAAGLNLFDVLNYNSILVSKDAVNFIEGVYSHDKRTV